METIKALAIRSAVRKYRKEQISDSELNTVLYAGSLAPVGLAMFNSYRLTVVRDRDFMARVEKAAIRAFGDNSEMKSVFYGAPTLIIISANKSQDLDSPFAKIPADKMSGLEVASAAYIADGPCLFSVAGETAINLLRMVKFHGALWNVPSCECIICHGI
ncbi:MAG: nitroreductase family protein [Clostridiales bacterium]|jgi:hypothetical protein|nr:nitroreductase family protein [Clostridiales bacterium]